MSTASAHNTQPLTSLPPTYTHTTSVPETRGQARAFEAPQLTTLANGLRVVSQETHATVRRLLLLLL